MSRRDETPIVPLRDDPDAPLGLRDDLERVSRSAPAFDVSAAVVRFSAAMKAPPIPSAPPPPPATGATAAMAGGSKVIAWGIGGTIAGLALLAGVVLGPRFTRSRPVQPAAVATSPAGIDSAVVPPATAPADATSAPTRTGSASGPSVTVELPDVPDAPSAKPSSDAARAQAARQDMLAEEIQHLAKLRTVTSPSEALAMAEDGQRRFATGVFSQEREAIAITSLTRLGRASDARARLKTFVARHPNSPLAESLKKTVGVDGN